MFVHRARHRPQVGRGVGRILKMIVRPLTQLFSRAAAKPVVRKVVKTMAKNAANEGLQVGKEVIASVLEGDDWKSSLKRNASRRGKNVASKSLAEIKRAISDSNPSELKPRKNIKRPKVKREGPKKRARKVYYNDIFG